MSGPSHSSSHSFSPAGATATETQTPSSSTRAERDLQQGEGVSLRARGQEAQAFPVSQSTCHFSACASSVPEENGGAQISRSWFWVSWDGRGRNTGQGLSLCRQPRPGGGELHVQWPCSWGWQWAQETGRRKRLRSDLGVCLGDRRRMPPCPSQPACAGSAGFRRIREPRRGLRGGGCSVKSKRPVSVFCSASGQRTATAAPRRRRAALAAPRQPPAAPCPASPGNFISF